MSFSPDSPSVILKKGREKSLLQRHPWIFSGAIEQIPSTSPGDILPVYSYEGHFLGSGYFNPKCSIIGRMLTFDETPPLKALENALQRALDMRNHLIDRRVTTGFRIVNGEGDGLPGLVLDYYDDVAVLQIATAGMEKLKPAVIEWVKKSLPVQFIYEKSELPSRKEEGLSPKEGVLVGTFADEVLFKENGLTFALKLKNSQKTGFFLDQREMRQLVKELAKGKRVLNTFSYTGGFSVYASSGGAICVDSVDISKEAIECAKRNMQLNGADFEKAGFFSEDVFDFLRKNELSYDMVILDPPAFAKKKKDIIPACRGYKDINRVAMQKMPKNSLLLTCSCSHYVDRELFRQVLFQAALEAKRDVRIVAEHRLAADHPINIYHKESDYLKSFLLYVN